jgi:hypothetical protein
MKLMIEIPKIKGKLEEGIMGGDEEGEDEGVERVVLVLLEEEDCGVKYLSDKAPDKRNSANDFNILYF